MATLLPKQYEIRRAITANARCIAELHVATWRDAYRGIVPEDYLTGIDSNAKADRWQSMLEARVPSVLVATLDGTIARWIAFGPTRDGDADTVTAEIEAVYVTSPCWQRGIGTALMQAACTRLLADGYAAVTLWVLDDNLAARCFYARRGFERGGSEEMVEIGGVLLPEVRFRATLHA